MHPAKWKPVPGWEQYEVSDQGEVRRKVGHRRIKPYMAKGTGRLVVNLRDRHGRTHRCLHMLVLEAFLGEREPYGQWMGRHINGDHTDNRLSNLKYVRKPVTARKPNADRDEILRLFKEGVRRKVIGAQFGISDVQVVRIGSAAGVAIDPKCQRCRERCTARRNMDFIDDIGPLCGACKEDVYDLVRKEFGL